MDNLTKEQRHVNMSHIRSSNTKLEQKFFQMLVDKGIEYVDHPKLYGKPDCMVGDKLLVFIDSDFWHGWNFSRWKDRLPKEYWVDKIARNIKRDKAKFRKLRRMGYRVVRVWGHEVKETQKVLKKISYSID